MQVIHFLRPENYQHQVENPVLWQLSENEILDEFHLTQHHHYPSHKSSEIATCKYSLHRSNVPVDSHHLGYIQGDRQSQA